MVIIPKLSVKNLTKTFPNGLKAIENVTLQLQKGEFVSLIGPSGCGKSTLFNIIAGLDEPTSGIISIDGKTDNNRLGTSGYMLQKPLLLPWKTVEENVMLGLTIQHVPKNSAKEQARELLKRFELLEFAKHYPATLSGGMAQRIALLRTVLFNKHFLLMDEPFGALDALTRLSMQMWLLRIWNEFQSSVLFITHDVREALLLSDRMYILSRRPAQVIQEVKIRLPRPRKKDHLALKQAIQLEKELEDLLLKEQKYET